MRRGDVGTKGTGMPAKRYVVSKQVSMLILLLCIPIPQCLHDLPITSLSFDEEAKHLATGSSDWTVRVWDLKKDVMELTVAALVAEDKRATLAEVTGGGEGRGGFWLVNSNN